MKRLVLCAILGMFFFSPVNSEAQILKKLKRKDIIVIVGGVIPQQDYDFLFESGVSGIFGPGTIISESVIEILNKVLRKKDD